jgi:hypothetical protein
MMTWPSLFAVQGLGPDDELPAEWEELFQEAGKRDQVGVHGGKEGYMGEVWESLSRTHSYAPHAPHAPHSRIRFLLFLLLLTSSSSHPPPPLFLLFLSLTVLLSAARGGPFRIHVPPHAGDLPGPLPHQERAEL